MKSKTTTQNNEVYFNSAEYEAELLAIKKEIDLYNNCINALEVITGSKELKSIEYVKEFICALSGFPAIQQSAELLNVSNEYNYLKTHLENIKSDKSEIGQMQLDELKEKHTTRLTDETQLQFELLQQIAKVYPMLNRINYINAIRCNDGQTYSVNALQLHQLTQIN